MRHPDFSMLPKLDVTPVLERGPGVFWRPKDEFVAELASYLAGKRVLEIFAGNGYLAGALSKHGIQVTSTTIFSGHDCHQQGLYYPVMEMGAVEAVLTLGGNYDVLLVSWPLPIPAMYRAAIEWGRERPIVYIGETTDYSKNQLGGCATDEFFEIVAPIHQFKSYEGNVYESALVYRVNE